MKRILIPMVFLVAFPFSANAEYSTLDDMAKAFGDTSCMTCHEKVHKEWKVSFHSQSVVHSLGGLRNFLVHGVKEAWKQQANKEHLMRCMDCHAPQLKEASESLAAVVVDLILTAVDDKDESKKAEAVKKLSGLNVSCIICHNT